MLLYKTFNVMVISEIKKLKKTLDDICIIGNDCDHVTFDQSYFGALFG